MPQQSSCVTSSCRLVFVMLTINPKAGEPPFEQVRRYFATAAAEGRIKPGYRLPTVRELASELGLAVNTVARAYRELAADGIIITQGRRGSFIAGAPDASGAEVAIGYFISAAKRRGMSIVEAQDLLAERWEAAAAN
jgi:DNA-binding transcriptional regulator YhcF (GntR family)